MLETSVLVGGVLTALILQGLKALKGVPLRSGQKGKLRVVAGVLSIVATIGLRLAGGGELDAGFMQTAAESLSTYLVAGLTYFSVLKK